MDDDDTQGVDKGFWPQGHGWQDLCRVPLDIALYQIYKLWAWT